MVKLSLLIVVMGVVGGVVYVIYCKVFFFWDRWESVVFRILVFVLVVFCDCWLGYVGEDVWCSCGWDFGKSVVVCVWRIWRVLGVNIMEYCEGILGNMMISWLCVFFCICSLCFYGFWLGVWRCLSMGKFDGLLIFML